MGGGIYGYSSKGRGIYIWSSSVNSEIHAFHVSRAGIFPRYSILIRYRDQFDGALCDSSELKLRAESVSLSNVADHV